MRILKIMINNLRHFSRRKSKKLTKPSSAPSVSFPPQAGILSSYALQRARFDCDGGHGRI